MSQTLKVKVQRGLKANLPILSRGELAYTTDTNELFIGVLAEPTNVSDNVLINNIPFATKGEAEAGIDNTKVMTPLRTKEAIDAQTNIILTGSYLSFGDLATKQQAEDGTLNSVWMSPERTKQAIAEFADTNVIEVVQAEGTPLSITNKTVNVTRSALGAAATSHTHTISDVTNLQTTLDTKAPLASPTFTGQVAFTPTTLGTTGTIRIDFSGDTYRTQAALTGNIAYTGSNYANGRSVTIRVLNGGTQRTLTFPAGWKFVGAKPDNIAANKVGILTLASFGTTESDVVAGWAVEA